MVGQLKYMNMGRFEKHFKVYEVLPHIHGAVAESHPRQKKKKRENILLFNGCGRFYTQKKIS